LQQRVEMSDLLATGMVVGVLLVVALGLLLLVRSLTAPPAVSGRVEEWQAKGKYYPASVGSSFQDIFYVLDSPPKECASKEKRLLCLIHGYPTSSFDWHRVWPSLHATFTQSGIPIVAMDLLGYGFSAKPVSLEGRSDLGEQIHVQADIVEQLLLHIHCQTDEHLSAPTAVDFLVHDYGDTVGQELLHRFRNGEVDRRLGMRSIAFLNGGMEPAVHRPVLLQKALAAPLLGGLLCRLLTRGSFGRSFSAVFGSLTQPSETELDEHWALLCYNKGWLVQPSLIKYMEQRAKHRLRWTSVLKDSGGIPWCMIDGPADPVSGTHMAKAVAELGGCRAVPWEEACSQEKAPFVQLLPEGIGHYPQLESPSATLKVFQHFHSLLS